MVRSSALDEASNLIDAAIHEDSEITEGQLRRLRYYGMSATGMDKFDAAQAIDSYKSVHPESERGYQESKAMDGRPMNIQSGGITSAKRDPVIVGIIAAFIAAVTALSIYPFS